MSQTTQTFETLHQREYVKAGAGAGKTFRITQKLGALVEQGDVKPENILAVTFTNAAASEMRTRIRTFLIEKGLRESAEKVQEATISTIHGFGMELIERFAFEQGISPRPRQLTEAEENQLIRKALAEVEAIEKVLYDLEKFGYNGRYNGKDYITAVDRFKSRILAVIKKLRTLGKGESAGDLMDLMEDARQEIERLYGQNLSKAQTLNKELWQAIETLKQAYPDQTVLSELWGSNNAARTFINAVYRATPEKIARDWRLWAGLQTIKAPKIEKADDGFLAENVWMAADKLSVHPGPLDEAKSHLEALLAGAVEALSLYQQAKRESGLVDFSDMVHLADQILNSPDSLQEMVERYDCLIIDEFQDTNPLQFALLNRFQQAGVPTLIVGDLKQSIMGFQGSDARLFAGLLAKGEASPDIKVDELTHNWRSTPAMMKFVNKVGVKLYAEAYQSLDVDPKAEYESSLPAVQKLVFDPKNWAATRRSKNKHSMNEDAFNTLAHHIAELLKKGIQITDKHTRQKRPLMPSDIAVLGANHDSLQKFSGALKQFGISTKLTQSGLLQSEAVQWVLNALKYVADPSNHYAVLDLLTSSYANQPLQPLLETFIRQRYFSDPIVDSLQAVSKHAKLVPFPQAVGLVMEALLIWENIAQRDDYAQQRANVLKLLELAQTFQDTQPESLEAMGIFGKNLNTFIVWVKENADSEGFDQQPPTDLNAQNSVVLSTWHASKGLEWPVVMVLNMDKEFSPKLPSIDVAYQSDDIDQMLKSSYVRFLFEFADSSTKQKMLEALREDNLNTLKNLTYVVLTRARESLILPWFDNKKPVSLLGLIKPLFEPSEFECKEINAVYIDVPENIEPVVTVNQVLSQTKSDYESIPAVISPSELHNSLTEQAITELAVQTHQFSDALDLSKIDALMAANEVGTWVHKVYEVGLKNPTLIKCCDGLLPKVLQASDFTQKTAQQVTEFKAWIEQRLQPISIQSEVPILAKNTKGQTISGTIDLLVETEQGYWIIDHKTDKEADIGKHIGQLVTYAQCLPAGKKVTHLAVNWVRSGKLDLVEVS